MDLDSGEVELVVIF